MKITAKLELYIYIMNKYEIKMSGQREKKRQTKIFTNISKYLKQREDELPGRQEMWPSVGKSK